MVWLEKIIACIVNRETCVSVSSEVTMSKQFVTFLQDMESRSIRFVLVSDGRVKVQAPVGALTLEIQRTMKDYKAEVLSWLKSGVPISFYLRKCAHCGRVGEARRREDGVWLCPCYWGNQQAELFSSDVA